MFPTPDVGRDPVDRGYLLPDEPEGHPLRCVSFLIPDTIEYRAALYRQVYNLGVTETWDRTDAHKAMLAAEVWTGALQGSFTVFEDDCPVITQIRPDPSGCGNLEQSTDGGVIWTDIAGTDFLPRNGLCAMTGGLEITPTADVQPAITITMPAARTNKLMQWNVGETGQEGFISKWGFLHIGKSSDESFGAIDVFQRKNNNVGFRGQNSGTSGSNYGMILDTFGAGGGVNYGAYFGARLAGTNRAMAIVDPPLASSNHAMWITAAAQNYIKGAVGIGNEFTTAYKLQVNQDLNSSLNAILDVMAIERNPSGTPTTGFGIGYAFRGKSSTTNNQPMARITTEWETPTHATRAAKLKMLVNDFSGEKTIIEAGVTGASTPKIGVMGATPQPRLAITGDTYGIPALDQVVQALALFGWVTDASTSDETIPVLCDVRCQIASGGYTVIAGHIHELAAFIASLSGSDTLAEVLADTRIDDVWGYRYAQPTFNDLVTLMYNYPDQAGMVADLLGLAEEMIERIWCELDDCAQPSSAWQGNVTTPLLLWPEDDPHFLIGTAISAIFGSEADVSLSNGYAVVPLGVVDCSTFDCEFPEAPEPPPEPDFCFYYPFTETESWELATEFGGQIGEWRVGDGWINDEPPTEDNTVVIKKVWGASANIVKISVDFVFSTANYDSNNPPEFTIQWGTTNALLKTIVYGAGGAYTMNWVGSITTSKLRFLMSANIEQPVQILNATVWGNGTEPTDTEAEECV